MSADFGDEILSVFDVWEDSREYLASIINLNNVRDEDLKLIFDKSLIAGAEDWHSLIECANSIAQSLHGGGYEHDVLASIQYVWGITQYHRDLAELNSWEETDQLILQAQKLQEEAQELLLAPGKQVRFDTGHAPQRQLKRGRGLGTTSHYWSDEPAKIRKIERSPEGATETCRFAVNAQTHQFSDELSANSLASHLLMTSVSGRGLFQYERQSVTRDSCYEDNTQVVLKKSQFDESPYFSPPDPDIAIRIRPAAGTVSSIPFPTLESPSFGLIQEKVAHEPFWLLVAITFLIKTNGKAAIPVFHRVKERFPSPSEFLEPENTGELLDMIRHLGLSQVRLSYIQRYAQGFLDRPPRAGVVYRVKNYDKREMNAELASTYADENGSDGTDTPSAGLGENLEAWEIGHMTSGKYALDSWRIFCRDALLDRAQDWNGRGREPEFQPEWMRVRPDDKELRAYLRWMWMREGWEWDPITGEKTVLRNEMRRAVNEGRVEWDNLGALRILDQPRDDVMSNKCGEMEI